MSETSFPQNQNLQDWVSTLTFEQAMAELESLVRLMEEGKLSLEDSIAFFEKGAYLRQYCEEKLKNARLKVEQIQVQSQGQILKTSLGA